MFEIKVDTSRLEAAIQEFAQVSHKDLGVAMRQAGGTMVGQLIGVTPPAHQETLTATGGVSLAAKKAGEARISSDIAKLFPTTGLKDATVEGMVAAGHKWVAANGRRYPVSEFARSVADLKRIHKASRNPRTGRSNAGYGANMAITRTALRRAYINAEKKKVGLLSAGWINAARELKTAGRYIPSWIKRHGAGPGGADVREAGGKVAIRIYNANPWFSGGWDRRLAYVVSRGEKSMKAAMEAVLARRAAAAQRRMGR